MARKVLKHIPGSLPYVCIFENMFIYLVCADICHTYALFLYQCFITEECLCSGISLPWCFYINEHDSQICFLTRYGVNTGWRGSTFTDDIFTTDHQLRTNSRVQEQLTTMTPQCLGFTFVWRHNIVSYNMPSWHKRRNELSVFVAIGVVPKHDIICKK